MATIVYVENTNVLEVHGLKSAIEDLFINDADVEFTLVDASTNTPILGQTWPTMMDYVTGTDGNYRAILKDGLELSAQGRYTAVIDADGGTDRIGHWEFPIVPRTRINK